MENTTGRKDALITQCKKVNTMGYISNVELLKNSGTVVEKENEDGSTHTTVYNEAHNWRVSWDKDPKGNISNIHSTNQSNNTHINYNPGPK